MVHFRAIFTKYPSTLWAAPTPDTSPGCVGQVDFQDSSGTSALSVSAVLGDMALTRYYVVRPQHGTSMLKLQPGMLDEDMETLR